MARHLCVLRAAAPKRSVSQVLGRWKGEHAVQVVGTWGRKRRTCWSLVGLGLLRGDDGVVVRKRLQKQARAEQRFDQLALIQVNSRFERPQN